jgi:aminoglycoside phosphotransferase family enzyme
LAPDVYLGVVTVTYEPHVGFALDGEGRPVDWLVWMRRLPAASMLDAAIRAGWLRCQEVQRVASLLASFLASAPRIAIDPLEYLARIRRECERSLTEIAAGPIELHPSAGLDGTRLERFLSDHAPLLAERAPLLIDAHGDLRPEHICLSEPPAIIDCLEFSAELRLRDPVDELAYLGMECARIGAPQIAPVLLTAYRQASNDQYGPALLSFYRAFRALIRARLAIAHLRSHSRHLPKIWLAQARSYLEISTFEIALAELP